ncbi:MULTISPECIES: GNAT family N-acetyltransferase [Clostridium]|uniref:GNAT family N-acetyltransferase n=1 Tax=Clostridium TaxID=1485 RepID=UPI000DD02352|nr:MULTISPECIES: GNAT family N-acetyltransferase [Clostridium]MDU1278465.1 GNAT family N-acetyltransferase [Clostridium sp.]MDU7004933.1 GNAT family N-acetyltransferase [Clostridium sp.]MDU7088767.1 GNAT family N-acetyltransferase [Clostridium sp.]MDU7949079.1 GNAT family N-acetyltransferase [Clostridium sp.]
MKFSRRCPKQVDAEELSRLRIKIDCETENLDREPGEGLLSSEDLKRIIYEDSISRTSLFLIAEVNSKIVGFTRCEGNKLSRFKHKAEFGICISKEYWGYGIGKALLENVLIWAESREIRKISLTVVETNKKAINLYKRYGFIEEGLLVNDRIHKDCNYYNTVIMGKFLDS